MPRAFKTKCDKNENSDILIILLLHFNGLSLCVDEHTSIHQTTSACKNKAKAYINSYQIKSEDHK